MDLHDATPESYAAGLEARRRQRQQTDHIRSPFPLLNERRRADRWAACKEFGVVAGAAVMVLGLLWATSAVW